MRVAFDEQIFAIQRHGGISRMFAELIRAFVAGRSGVEVAPLHAPIINRYVLDDPVLARATGARAASTEWSALARYFTRVSRRADADVVHNTFYLPHGLVSSRGAARVVTVHDMIPELLPETRRRLDFLTLKRRYVTEADHVICVSEWTRRDLERIYGPLRASISVVHHGVDPRFAPGAAPLEQFPSRYLLFVGNRGSYKDADVLFRALQGLPSDIALVCVGGGSLTSQERVRLRSLGIEDRVSQTTLPDSEMASAYGNALAFVFPSRFEGFGLPILEAMACGAPVVLARATAFPEVGGDAARYFEPGDDRDLIGVLREIVGSEAARAELGLRGLERARAFSWSAAAARTAEAYAEAMDTLGRS